MSGNYGGIQEKSNELMVTMKLGIVTARSVRWIPVERRWTIDSLEWVGHAPWHMYKDAEDADGEIPEGVTAKDREEKKEAIEKGKDSEGKTVYVDVRERMPREFCMSRRDAERFNQYTRGCPGRNSWFKGGKCHTMSSVGKYLKG